MAWGAFCGTTLSILYFVPGKAKLDSAAYVKYILDPILIPFWHRMCEEKGWTVVIENGAPGHKKYVKTCRQLNKMEVIEWPPQSPDLNLIEAIWGDMETELRIIFGCSSNIENLQRQCHAVFKMTTKERLSDLLTSMKDRLNAVILAGGAATPY
jgi:hypothetical protein